MVGWDWELGRGVWGVVEPLARLHGSPGGVLKNCVETAPRGLWGRTEILETGGMELGTEQGGMLGCASGLEELQGARWDGGGVGRGGGAGGT